ncbi:MULTISPECIES: carboxymuconolactone decarboxylase family protein [unclassified Pseudofrankia]|uniref:carboxymuconolactone decarboxylase family protein n=1 Tax=unclassified Pseudofrankia TaxID=2994372 RepID=UPI0008D9B5B0|nr:MULTISPECIES: carboxymuconolactone decarboxylase family protein [unclassified Pseudofrankia]MDT3442219.1 carboxymuconolactone decarboxylase family protein [Pseudofrankia sp. BMG5.37]OHV43568.1 carboxymuconolactone decarboxylase [Pseudofrankia sp. BMG5.36]
MMTQAEREAAYERIVRELAVDRMGTEPDAPPLPPWAGTPSPRAGSTLPIEAEIAGVQMIEYGEFWARPGLDLRTRSFITLAALQATRGMYKQLYRHVNIALNLGITPNEIHETFLQAGCYCGLPAVENAADVATAVFVHRGILAPGDGATVEPKAQMDHQDRRAAMARVAAALGVNRVGLGPDAPPLVPLPGPLAQISSTRGEVEGDLAMIGAQYGYGELWGRAGLDLRTRSFITMAVLQVVVENDQLHIHVNNALNLGIPADEIHEAIAHVGMYGGVSGSHNAGNVAKDVLRQWGLAAK